MDLVNELKEAATEQKEILAPEVLYYDADEAEFETGTIVVKDEAEEKVKSDDNKVRGRRKGKNPKSVSADPLE